MSEKRKMSQVLGLRVTPEIFGGLLAEAEDRNITHTALAREIIARHLGDKGPLPSAPPRRGAGPVKARIPEKNAAVFTAEFMKTGARLQKVNRHLQEARREGTLSKETFEAYAPTLQRTALLMADIRKALLGDDDTNEEVQS